MSTFFENRERWIVALVLLLFFVALLIGVKLPKPQSPPPPTVAKLDLTAACSGNRWIGELEVPEVNGEGELEPHDGKSTAERQRGEGREDLRCPDGWEWVFQPSDGQKPLPGLQRFCLFKGDDPRPGLRRIRRKGEGRVEYDFFESIEQDCRVIGTAAKTLFPPAGFASALKARFEQEVGWDPSAVVSSKEVRLVILDSVQDDATSPEDNKCPYSPSVGDLECSPHGEILVRLARDLLCTGPDCGAQITTRRALRRTHRIKSAGGSPTVVELGVEDSDGVQGGTTGTREDLAQAICREVDEWQSETDRPKLILNLSVGWNKVIESDSTAASNLVREAIRNAACRGALVIAAAGNRVAGPASLETPLLPAAWELEPAPSVEDCQEYFGVDSSGFTSDTDYRPLIYAVGAVQQDGRPLSNSRPETTPRRVAFGDHAPVSYPGQLGQPARLATLTGTSVSTLVVSEAAAVRWSQALDLASFDVMADLISVDTQVPVDFCLDPAANCPAPGTLAERVYIHKVANPARTAWPAGEPPFNSQTIASLTESGDWSAKTNLPDCDPQPLESIPPLPPPPPGANLCPQMSYDIAVSGVAPQLGPNHNPNCTFTQGSPGTVLLEFDPRFRVGGLPAEVSDFTLIVRDKAFRLSNEKLTLGKPAMISKFFQIVLSDFSFDGVPPEKLYPMYLVATVNGEHATVTPILQVFYEYQAEEQAEGQAPRRSRDRPRPATAGRRRGRRAARRRRRCRGSWTAPSPRRRRRPRPARSGAAGCCPRR